MVDALRDAWRALAEGGTLLDLRPRAENNRLELVTPDAAVPVGYTDTTSRADSDTAADAAVAAALARGWFTVRTKIEFDLEIVWDSVDDLEHWAASRTSTHVSPSFAELESIYRRGGLADGERHFRSVRRMILGSYARREP